MVSFLGMCFHCFVAFCRKVEENNVTQQDLGFELKVKAKVKVIKPLDIKAMGNVKHFDLKPKPRPHTTVTTPTISV